MWAARLNYLLRTLEVVCVHVSLSQSFFQPASIRVLNQVGRGGGEGEGTGEGEGRQEKSNWCARGRPEFLNYLIPVSAQRHKVGVPVFPGDSGSSPLLIRFTSEPHTHTHLPPIFCCAPRQGKGQPAEIPFEYDGRDVSSEEWRHGCQAWPRYPSAAV